MRKEENKYALLLVILILVTIMLSWIAIKSENNVKNLKIELENEVQKNITLEETVGNIKTENEKLKSENEKLTNEINAYIKESNNTRATKQNTTSRSETARNEMNMVDASEGTYLGWFSSTGYCTEDWRGTGKAHSCNSGDPTVGAMGEKVIPYQTVAVDPQIIPLGSQLKVATEDGRVYYVKANDTGGAIKGKKIDMVCSSHADAFQWGRRNVQVWIIE